ncbi:MAG: protease modulator HflC [Victivallales bacterium]|nr:protease modulator HflC [Victivallales bacterium]
MSEEKQGHGIGHHWPIVGLACLVVVIFLVAMMSFQVKETEYAVIKTFGKAKVDANGQIITYPPGLHFKRPFVDSVWRFDKRLQCYELTKGHLEQLTTKDQYQIIVSTYVFWRVGDPGKFLKRLKSVEEVEEKLDAAVRDSRNSIIPMHNFSELVSTETSDSKMAEIENAMLSDVSKKTMEDFGIEVTKIGFRQLGFPETVTTKVFDRMRAERENHSQRLLAEGLSEAQKIRSEADRKASEIRSQAEADAKRIRGEGDEIAAKHYAVFQKNPDLAIFLRSLDALKNSLGAQDTLILDTDTPPFTLLKPNAATLGAKPATK